MGCLSALTMYIYLPGTEESVCWKRETGEVHRLNNDIETRCLFTMVCKCFNMNINFLKLFFNYNFCCFYVGNTKTSHALVVWEGLFKWQNSPGSERG